MASETHVYRRRIDPQGQDSLAHILRLIRPGSRVLELGAAVGYLSEHLSREAACNVDAVELDPGMAREARRYCNRFLVCDLQREILSRHFPGRYYDYVILADVLEHLTDPERVLRQLPDLLRPGGRLLVSVPNTAYAGLIMELISGDLRYRPEGLLDRTHVRLFTRASILRLLEDCAFRVESIAPVQLPYEHSEFGELMSAADTDWVDRLTGLPDANTYQFVISAEAAQVDMPRSPPLVDVVLLAGGDEERLRQCILALSAYPQRTPYALFVLHAAGDARILACLDDIQGRVELQALDSAGLPQVPHAAAIAARLPGARDLVLLQDAARVHGDWLDRLHHCAHHLHDIGSVTPLQSHGRYSGYPLPESSMQDWPPEALDILAAQTNSGLDVDIQAPETGCLYLKRECLADTDSAAFLHAPTVEECIHALAAAFTEQGFRHRLCTGLHITLMQGPARDEPDATGQAAAELAYVRQRLHCARVRQSPRARLLFVTGYRLGETERHVRRLAGLLSETHEILVLRPHGDGRVALGWEREPDTLELYFVLPRQMDDLVELLRSLGVERIHYHQVGAYPPAILDLADRMGLAYDFTVHDYYSFCPQFTLTDANGRYCREPDETQCAVCIRQRPPAWDLDIIGWRGRFAQFLGSAERVLVPSEDAAKRMLRRFPRSRIIHCPPPEIPLAASSLEPGRGVDRCKVLVLGDLSPASGIHQLEACARDAQERGLALSFRLLGSPRGALGQLPDIPVSISGSCNEHDLVDLMRIERGDMLFFPCLWPAPYTPTLSAAMATGLPLLAPDLGAFREHLAGSPAALLVPWDIPPGQCNERLLDMARTRGILADELGIRSA